jgi:ribosome biogenesis GTPase A
MHRAQRRLLAEVRRVDLVVEVRDARLPLGSANPELERLAARRPRLILFNKASLADPAASRAWARYFAGQGRPALFGDAERAVDARRVLERILVLTEPKRHALGRRGIRPPDPRVMVVGIPNVGKSTLINRLLRRKGLPTGPEPGVTRSTRWVPLRGRMLLLDTPGVLLPRIGTDQEALRLGWIGALPQHLLGAERLALALLERLNAPPGTAFLRAYGLSVPIPADPAACLPGLAQARHFLTRGGEPDTARAAGQLLHDFRDGRLGRLTFEVPPKGE